MTSAEPGGVSTRMTVVGDVADLRPLVGAWRALLERTPDSCAYQSPEWVLTWFEQIGHRDEVRVLVFHRGDELVGIAPFSVTLVGASVLGLRVLMSAATEPGDYGDPLLAIDGRGELAAEIAEHLAEFASGVRHAVAVRRVDETGVLYQALQARRDVVITETSSFGAPVTRFSDWTDPDDEIERVAASLKLPKQRRRLERDHGEVRVSTREPIASSLTELAAVQRERFGVEEAPKLLQRPVSSRLVISALERFDEVGLARMCRLTAGESTAALELGHSTPARWVGQAAGFDPAFGKFRPGYLLVHGILHQARLEGALEYDHGQGARAYKLHWATRERRHRSVVITRRGPWGQAQRFEQRFVASRRARTLLEGDA